MLETSSSPDMSRGSKVSRIRDNLLFSFKLLIISENIGAVSASKSSISPLFGKRNSNFIESF